MRQSHQTSDAIRGLPPWIQVRQLEPSDRAAVAGLFDRLSPESRRRRFLVPKPRLSARELTYLTVVDHHWHEALAAVDRRDGSIVGIARYAGVADRRGVADTAVAVADELQRQGIATALTRCLVARARVNGFDVLSATTMWENRPARALLRRLGFRARASEGTLIELELQLCPA